MENYFGKMCPFCKTEIKKDEPVKVCPACGIPHHESCWEENKGCTTFGCCEQHYEIQGTNPTYVCSNCGASLGDGQNFCPKCGTPKIVQQVVCQKCGASISDGQVFCSRCGQKVGVAVTPVVNAAITQFNNVQESKLKKKKLSLKIGIAGAAVLIIAVVIVIISVLFKSPEDYMAQADYEKAYSTANTLQKNEIKKENLVAYISNMCVGDLKYGDSFKLIDAWVNYDTDSRQVVLKLSAKNSYGDRIINYWYYTYDATDQEYSLYTTLTDLDRETINTWSEPEETTEIILRNDCREKIKEFMDDNTTFVDEESVNRINILFENDLLDDVVLLSENQ